MTRGGTDSFDGDRVACHSTGGYWVIDPTKVDGPHKPGGWKTKAVFGMPDEIIPYSDFVDAVCERVYLCGLVLLSVALSCLLGTWWVCGGQGQ